jgi:hypothetical protein
MVFLAVEAADDDADEEVQEKERANDHESNEEEDPIGMTPLLPDLIHLSHLGPCIHEV